VQKLTRRDLLDITDAAVFLASGGGGPISLKKAMVELLVQEGPVVMASVDEVKDDDLVAVVAGAGSPATLQQEGGIVALAKASTRALTSLEQAIGKKANSIVAIETGAGNTLLPMAAAVRLKIPVLDGAGARRSVPSITMCTFGELPVSPIRVVDEHLNVIGLDIPKPTQAEDPLMTLIGLPQFGNLAGLAMWPMSGKVAKAGISRGTVSYSLRLGQQLRKARSNGSNPVTVITKFVKGYRLFAGTLRDVETHELNSFDYNVVVLENKSGKRLRLYGQNETLIVWSSSCPYPLAMGPDLICYVTKTGATFSNADIQTLPKDTEIVVIGAPAPPDLRTPRMEALFLASLRNLGYGGPYVSIEQLRRLNRVIHGAAHPHGSSSGNAVIGW
jgi:uncharacterized protein